ncbi:MAG TPA: amidohydrolase family protein [Gemmatimonadales bacterium]|nr:amidohydrolase family protein [Gemmatimonadales bacterium]
MRSAAVTRPVVIACLMLSITGARVAREPGSTQSLLSLEHATLINPGVDPVANSTVLIQNDRITCAGTASACPRPAGAKAVDLSGMFLGPGLIDSHVHYSQTGWVDGRPDAADLRSRYPYDSVVASLREHPERFHRANLCSGVTTAFDVGGFPWTYDLARRTRQATDAPRVVAVGPLLATITVDSQMMGQFVYMSSDSVVRAAVDQHRAAGAEAIKVWYIQVPDSLHPHAKAMLMAAGDETRKVGLRLIVHATELPNAKDALEAGARVLVHDVEEGLVDQQFLRAVRRNGTIVIPTLTVLEGYADVFLGRSPQTRYPLDCVDPITRHKLETVLPDSLRVRGKSFWSSPKAAALMSTSVENLRRMYHAGVPIAMGTDAGNPGTAHGPSVYREMELMQQAGMAAPAVFSSATIVAAQAAGLDQEVGSVAPGKRADLVVFGADPTRDIHNARQVKFVIRNGALHSRQDLLPQ